MKDRDTEGNGDSEKRRNGDSQDTQDTKDVPPLAASVKTLQEAVQLSLKGGLAKDCLFKYSRAIKAFEITHNRRLLPAELMSAFSLWWNSAKDQLPPDADFDEWRFDFENTFAKTTAALGANALEEAIRRADANPMPPQAARYASPGLKRLAAVCYQLQQLQGKSPFFIGVRDAAKVGGAKGLTQASVWLAGFVRDGILTEVEKGTRTRATRFRFNMSESEQAEVKQQYISPEAVHCDAPASPTPAAGSTKSQRTQPAEPRKPSTYELVERKKAVQALIDALPHVDYRKEHHRKRFKQLKNELDQINVQLANIPD